MAKLFFNLWRLYHWSFVSFAKKYKIFKAGTKVCQTPNQKHTKNVPKTFKSLPKWRNFAKSGHTEVDSRSRGRDSQWIFVTNKKCIIPVPNVTAVIYFTWTSHVHFSWWSTLATWPAHVPQPISTRARRRTRYLPSGQCDQSERFVSLLWEKYHNKSCQM